MNLRSRIISITTILYYSCFFNCKTTETMNVSCLNRHSSHSYNEHEHLHPMPNGPVIFLTSYISKTMILMKSSSTSARLVCAIWANVVSRQISSEQFIDWRYFSKLSRWCGSRKVTNWCFRTYIINTSTQSDPREKIGYKGIIINVTCKSWSSLQKWPVPVDFKKGARNTVMCSSPCDSENIPDIQSES